MATPACNNMTIIEALISGVVQGLTEFLPVSSSGHLVLVHRYFGLSEANIFFDICLHVGTLMAVILYFAKDIRSMILEKRINWFFTIRLNLHLIYDDDIHFPVYDANDQPVLNPDGSEKGVAKAQFKEFLGLALSFKF